MCRRVVGGRVAFRILRSWGGVSKPGLGGDAPTAEDVTHGARQAKGRYLVNTTTDHTAGMFLLSSSVVAPLS